MNTFIRLLYALLIAAAVVAFVGIGINTFYLAPVAPAYPIVPLEKGIAQPAGSPMQDNSAQLYQQQQDAYQAALTAYQRNVSIILACFAVVILALGIWLRSQSEIIAEGLQLGGIGASIYAVTMASLADDRIMRFVAVTLFLAGAIVVVYARFQEVPAGKKPARKHSKG